MTTTERHYAIAPLPWSYDCPDGSASIEIRRDTDEEALPRAAYVEIADEDAGEVDVWLHPDQVLQALLALGQVLGCEVVVQHRRVRLDGSPEGDWYTVLGPDAELGLPWNLRVQRRFVITTPPREMERQ
jgi:hypothetical protein